MIDSFYSSGNSSLFQIEIISLWIAQHIVLPPALINSAGIWSIPGDLWLLSFSIANSTSNSLGSGLSHHTCTKNEIQLETIALADVTCWTEFKDLLSSTDQNTSDLDGVGRVPSNIVEETDRSHQKQKYLSLYLSPSSDHHLLGVRSQ